MHPTSGVPNSHALPQPPRLHWGFVLLFTVITLGIFEPVWLIVQASWVRKVRGRSTARSWSIVYGILLPLYFVVVFVAIVLELAEPATSDLAAPVARIFQLAIIFARLLSIYMLRDELEKSPIQLSTSGVMTFFFGATYFQYHLRDFNYEEAARAGTKGTLSQSN